MKKFILLFCYYLLISSWIFGSNKSILVVSNPTITSNYPYVICGTGTLTLNASPNTAGNTYQWLFSTTETGTYTNIGGATASTFTTNATNNVGFYKVSINDGTTPALSSAFKVRIGGSVNLVSATPTTISAGGSSTLNFNFTGTAPWTFTLYGNNGASVRDYTFSASPATISVTPDSYRYFYPSNIYDANGVGCQLGGTTITVNPAPSITLGTPASTTVCAGNIIDIPITLNGTWGNANNILINAELTTTTGTSISGSFINGINGSSLKYIIPPGTPNGTYKIRANGSYPSTSNVSTSYNITIVNTGCGVNQPIITGTAIGCTPSLSAYPQGSGYTYQWYKDNVAVVGGGTSASYFPSVNQNGNYTVLVTNTALGFSGTSAAKAVTVTRNNVNTTATSSNLCISPVTISSTYTGAGYTYQWFRAENQANSNSTKAPLAGEINSTLSVTTPGLYDVRVWDGICQLSTVNQQTITLCPPSITSTNPIICGSNTQAVLQSSTNVAGIYQWSSATSEFGTYTNIVGATNSSFTATATGYYKVVDNAGTLSNAFRVNNAPYAVLLNPSGTTNAMNISPGGTAAITYKLYGTAPFTFSASDNINIRSVYSPTDQITLSYNTPSSRYYFVNNLIGAGCSTAGFSQNSMLVNVGTPTISLGTIPTTICAGEIMSVPYTLSGTFDSNISISANLYNVSTNTIVTTLTSSTNPLKFQIPSTLAAGTYQLVVYGGTPTFFSSSLTTTPNFSVTAACTPTAQANIYGYSSVCNGTSLTAIPNGSGYNFQWSRNGTVVSSGTSSNYYATESGNYTVLVTNSSNGYSSTSSIKTLIVNAIIPSISSPNPSLCGSNTSVTLTSSLTGAGYSYLWQKYNSSNFTYTTVAGQTTQTLTLTQVSEAGQYRVVVNDGNCDNTSANFTVSTGTTARLVNSSGNTSPVNLNPGQSEILQLQLGGQSPWTYTFQGLSYTSNTPTVSLPAVSPSVSTYYSVQNVASTGSACGTSNVFTSSVLVNVSPNPSFTIGTVSATACPGGLLQIPLTLTGNWGTTGFERFNVGLYTSTGTYVSNITYTSGSPMVIILPTTVAVGSVYKLYLSAGVPAVPSSQFTSNFTISSTCPAPPNALTTEENSLCSNPKLTAFPNGVGYVFQWKKNGVDISGATTETYFPSTSDNYTVNIQNVSLSYNSTSSTRAVTVNTIRPSIDSPNSILCGTNTSATISTTYTGAGYTYTWRKSSLSSGAYNIVSGATASSIIVTDVGRYYVSVNNGTCTFNSDIYNITYGGTGKLTNSNDNNDKVILVSPQTTENLKVNLTGTGPWEVGISDGFTTKFYLANSTPLIVPVSPTAATRYNITSVSNTCGVGIGVVNIGSVIVEPAPVATITFPTPSTLTVCKGNSINIPYTVTGSTIGGKSNLFVYLADATGGSSRSLYSSTRFALDPVPANGSVDLYIPDNAVVGTYSLYAGLSNINFQFTTYNINVVNTGCTATPAPVVYGYSNGCNAVALIVSIYGTFNGGNTSTYQWYKNGVLLTGSTSETFVATESGNYTVNVVNGAYNQTSAPKTVTINSIIPNISATTSVICSPVTSSLLSTNFTGAGYTYQWYKDNTFANGSTERIPIFGETNSSLTITSMGDYSLRVFDGACSNTSVTTNITGCTTCSINTSLMTGNWNTPATWSCGHVPLATEPVQIAPSHTVMLNTNGVVKSLDLRGILQKQMGFSLQVQGN
jgi:hypothetical protein